MHTRCPVWPHACHGRGQQGRAARLVRRWPIFFQPEAAEDVAATLADIAGGAPVNGIVELTGPERFRLGELVRRYLSAKGDPRRVVTDARAPYFGRVVDDDRVLVPGGDYRVGAASFADWLSHSGWDPVTR